MSPTYTGLPPQMDFSSYPPCAVAWMYTAIDTVCNHRSLCSNWREWLPASWTTAATDKAADSPSATVPWLSLSNKYPKPITKLLPPLTTYDEFVQQQQQQSSSGTIKSTTATMWEFAQTPSTTLADLTSGSALLTLVALVWIIRRIKATTIPAFSRFGKRAALHTHGEQWCAQPSNQIRITKFGEYVFRLCFHSMISIAGIILFWNSPWWADVVGSSKTNDTVVGTPTLFLDFPFQPIQPSMIWYYLIQAAYNIEAMICLLELSFDICFQSPIVSNINKKNSLRSSSTAGPGTTVQSPISIKWSETVRGDFREMFVHHVVTNMLIFGSSFVRMTRVGSMVFIVHDISDVPVDLSKLANFLKWKATTVTCFLSMVIVWLMTRLYVLPFVIFRSVVTESWLVCANGYVHPIYWVMYRPPFIVLMGLLILLHLIWFSMFIRMGYVLVSKGEAHDLSEHRAGEQEQQNQYHRLSNGSVNGSTNGSKKS